MPAIFHRSRINGQGQRGVTRLAISLARGEMMGPPLCPAPISIFRTPADSPTGCESEVIRVRVNGGGDGCAADSADHAPPSAELWHP